MIGCQDFCGYYDWTFEFLRRNYGEQTVKDYWEEAISRDSQRHARDLIISKGFEGMAEYWGHTLAEEEAGYCITRTEDVFRIDMFACPSKGFLIQHRLAAYRDYCEHCLGWIKPIMDEAGFSIAHEHNHRGQCWWEIRSKENVAARISSESMPSAVGEIAGDKDVRLHPNWQSDSHHLYLPDACPTRKQDKDAPAAG